MGSTRCLADFKEPYRLVVSNAHSLASRTSVSPKDLNKERILTRTYCEQIEDVSSFLDSHDCNSPARHEVATEDDLLRLLETDLGVAISPLSAARSDKVKVVSIEGFDLIRAVHVYAVAGRQRSTAATTLIKMLRAANWSAYERPQGLVNSAKTQ